MDKSLDIPWMGILSMQIMATGIALVADDSCKAAFHGVNNGRVELQYTEPVDWHF